MKHKNIIFILLSLLGLSTVSCSVEPNEDDYYNFYSDSGSPNGGDENKIDIKGSLTNGDMKNPNIEAWLSGNTLYVKFNETIENCMILMTTSGGRVVYSRQVEQQYPTSIRIYMGNKPSDDYRLYITDGHKEAKGWFSYEKQ